VTQIPEEKLLLCAECGAPMELRRGPKVFYQCSGWPNCKGKLGARPDGTPKGTPGTKLTKHRRIQAHRAFDLIWKRKLMSRGGAYRWLRQELGLTKKTARISQLTDQQCEGLIELVYTQFPQLHTRYTRLSLGVDL